MMDNGYCKSMVIKLLGGSVVDIELEDDIEDFISLSITKIKPYINSTRYVTVDTSSKLDTTEMGMYNVVAIYNANATTTGNANSDSLIFNHNYVGNNMTSSTESYVIHLLTKQLQNTVTGSSSMVDFVFNNNTLYVDTNNLGSQMTIEYVPDVKSLEDLTDPYWSNMVFDLTMAYTKIALGRARGKYRLSNLSYELDSDTILSEGTMELETLLGKLVEANDTFYILD